MHSDVRVVLLETEFEVTFELWPTAVEDVLAVELLF